MAILKKRLFFEKKDPGRNFLKRLSEKTTVDNPLLKPVDRSKKKTNLTMVTKVRNIINFSFLGYLKC